MSSEAIAVSFHSDIIYVANGIGTISVFSERENNTRIVLRNKRVGDNARITLNQD
jgi:hypothetical protein